MANQNKLIQERIDKYFTTRQEADKEIFRKLTLYIYSLQSGADNDLYILAKLLSKDDLISVINYFDGDILKLPSKEEFRRSNLIAIAFYLKEIYKDENGNNLTWKQIKDLMSLPENDQDMISSISLGRRINEIKEKIKTDMKTLTFDDIGDSIKESLNVELRQLNGVDVEELLDEVKSYE